MDYYSIISVLFKERRIRLKLIYILCILLLPVLSNGQTITGAWDVCNGSAMTLSGTPTGGVWSSSNPAIATVSGLGVVTGLASGMVTISYTIGSVSDTQMITVNALPAAITGASMLCEGGTGTLSDSTPGGTWSSSSPVIATINPSGVMAGVSAGTVTMAYTAPTGCFRTTIVTVNPIPGSISGTPTVCEGLTTSLSAPTSGGTWSSSSAAVAVVGSATGVVTGVSAGSTNISYTLATGCASSVWVTVNPLPAAITGALALCRDEAVTLSSASAGGTWASDNPTVAGISSSGGVVGAIAPGTTTISYTLPSGCFRTAVLTVNPSPAPITGPAAVCVADTITLSNSISGGTWSCSPPLAGIDPAGGTLTGYIAGTTTVSYTLSTGCYVTTTISINPVPAAITGLSNVCVGSSISLSNATGGGTWSSATPSVATVSSSGLVTGNSAGATPISYILPSGCATSTTITVNTLPPAITGAASVCAGASAILTNATSGGTWVSSNTSVAVIGSGTGVFTGVSAGTATITYTLATGCMSSTVVTVNPLPGAISGVFSICAGQAGTLSSSTSGGSWSSSATTIVTIGSATGVITGVSTGSANITYTAGGTGCTRVVNITVNALPSAISGSLSICEGTTSTLSSTPAGGTWASSNIGIAFAGAGGILTGISAGTASITYTSPVGCQTSSNVTINPMPATITGTPAVCLGATTNLYSASSGGAWTSSNTSIAPVGLISGIVAGDAIGTATITYTLLSGCQQTIDVTVNTLPTLGGTAAICIGGTTTLGGTPGSGTWSPSSSVVSVGATSGVITGLSAGTARVTYTLSTGCHTSLVVTVSAASTAGTITGPGAVCTGNNITLSSTVSGGTWASSNPTVATAGSLTGIINGVTAGTTTITYAISAVCGVVTATKTVTVNTTPAITGASAVCVGSSITYTATTGCGTWSSISPSTATVTSIGTGDTAIVTGVAPGITIITFTSCTGCIATKILSVNAMPGAILGGSSVCVDDILDLVEPATGGTWSSSDVSIATISVIGGSLGVVSGLAAGTATMTYMLGTGCYSTIVITVNPLPAITVAVSAAACGGTYTGVAGGGVTYTWLPASGLSCTSCSVVTLRPTATTTYTVTGTSAAGCVNTATVTLNGNRIAGHISFSGAAPASPGMKVWLIRYNPSDSSILAQDSVLTCLDGGSPYYQFDSLAAGSYMVKAKLLSSVPGTSGYVPTYGASTPTWFDAGTIVHASATDTQHIHMVYGTVPSGTSFISGYVYSGAGKGTSGQVPEVGVLVYLRNASTGKVLTYTYTDILGAYIFDSIALGPYMVYPEEFDYYTTPSIVELSALAPNKTDVDFKRHTVAHTIYPFVFVNGIGMLPEYSSVNLYPNPSNGDIAVQCPGHDGSHADVVVSDITGREVYKTTLDFDAAGHAKMNLQSVGAGIYTIHISGEEMNYFGRVMIEK